MITLTSLEIIGGIVSLPFYFMALYLFFTQARDRNEKRGIFFSLGLSLIGLSYVAEYLADLYIVKTLSILSNAAFGLAGISMIFCCYLTSKMLDEELTGGVS